MSFDAIARSTIAATAIAERLRDTSAVVLERIARAAGKTNWYQCDNQDGLNQIVGALSPGSKVSFYFDGRIARNAYTPQIRREIEAIANRERDAIIGALQADGFRIECDFVSSVDEIEEFIIDHPDVSAIYFGAFPAADNDGVQAITVTLPDRDGVVRHHPY